MSVRPLILGLLPDPTRIPTATLLPHAKVGTTVVINQYAYTKVSDSFYDRPYAWWEVQPVDFLGCPTCEGRCVCLDLGWFDPKPKRGPGSTDPFWR